MFSLRENPQLSDIGKAMEVVVNKPYDLRTILGKKEIPGLEFLGSGIQILFDYLLRNLKISGSAVSESAVDSSYAQRDLSPAKLVAPYAWLVERYYLGEIDTNALSIEAYTFLHVLLMLQGPNIDIKGWSRSEDLEETLKHIEHLLWFTFSFLYDGEKRIVSHLQQHGRHHFFHLGTPRFKGNGGINVLIFPYDHDNTYWSGISNWRKAQDADLTLSPDNSEWLVDSKFNEEAAQTDIELHATFQNRGQWLHHTARGIRTATTSVHHPGLNASQYLQKDTGLTEEIRFEDYVGIIANLIVSFMTNPTKTIALISELQLQKYLPGWSEQKAAQLALGTENNANNSWSETLDKVQADLSQLGTENALSNQKPDLNRISELYSLFSPLTPQQLKSKYENQQTREKVTGTVSAGSIGNFELYKQKTQQVLDTFNDIHDQLQAAGDPRANEVAKTRDAINERFLTK